ncbi:MAG: DUF3224 domain-containing protein [Candidatus Dormibacterales bacterium]
MGERAEGTFHVTSWEEKTYEALEGAEKLTRARIAQDFAGGLEGTGTWECLMYYRPDGTAAYTGLVRLAGRLDGRQGAFVVLSEGSYDGAEARATWEVVRGSGSGGLQGLSGRGTSVAPHGPDGTFSLDYEIE